MQEKLNPFKKEKFPNCHVGHQYALDIVNGKILANKWIVGACNRYLNDLKRIKEDKDCPFYFLPEKAEHFLRVVQKFHHAVGHWENPNILFEPWQKFIWMNIKGFFSHKTKMVRFRTAHIDVARGNAKALCLDTEIPTPTGIKKFKDISIGDKVFARDGSICTVIGETPIHYPNAYEIIFDNGNSVFASDKHKWFVKNKKLRSRQGKQKSRYGSLDNLPPKAMPVKDVELDTIEMINDVYVRKEVNYSIDKCKPVIGTKHPLIDMYYLGYWIGNGDKLGARLTSDSKDAEEIQFILNARGIKTSGISYYKDRSAAAINVLEKHTPLKDLGLIGFKHIPKWVFSCSKLDRLEFLQGLFDSDAHISLYNNHGRIEFSSVVESIANDVHALISSLGYKNTVLRCDIKSNFKTSNKYYYKVCFTPKDDVDFFKLKRKKERQVRSKASFTHNDRFYIRDIKPCGPMKMKCIQVDSKDGSFLITRDFIPTHNSTMASQAALYELCCDNPNGNRIYCAATSRDQAKEVLNGSQIMARKNESYLKHFGVDVRAHEILHPDSNSYMKAISAQANSLDGKIGQLIITDELHAMQRKTFEVLDSGQSKRRDSLLLSITTAGYENSGVGASQRKYAQKVALGDVEDDTFFAMVYCLDEEEHDIWDEKNWIMANPNWKVSVDPDNFSAKAKKAKENPEDQANFKIKHLNIYLGSLNQFYDVVKFKNCRDEKLRLEDLSGCNCFGGIDLSTKIDITSLGLVFNENNEYQFFSYNFIPEKRLEETKNRNYFRYVDQGDLIVTPGEVINYEFIENKIKEISKIVKFKDIHYDPWSATQMAITLSKLGFDMTEFRMSTGNLSEPTKKLQEIMQNRTMRHNNQELLEWCIGNVVAKYDAVGNVFPRKEHDSFKIDPIIAWIMGIAGWVNEDMEESVYKDRGMVFI